MSKRAEAIKVLRDMNDAELDEHLRQQRRKLFEMRFQQATGQVENHRQIREIRREIARTMTVQIQLQHLAVSEEPPGDARGRAPARALRPSRRVPERGQDHTASRTTSVAGRSKAGASKDDVDDVAIAPDADEATVSSPLAESDEDVSEAETDDE